MASRAGLPNYRVAPIEKFISVIIFSSYDSLEFSPGWEMDLTTTYSTHHGRTTRTEHVKSKYGYVHTSFICLGKSTISTVYFNLKEAVVNLVMNSTCKAMVAMGGNGR